MSVRRRLVARTLGVVVVVVLASATMVVTSAADNGISNGAGSGSGDVGAQNDIAPFSTVFNTDIAYAGLGGVRGLGSGTIALSGVSGTVTKAYLYWHGPTNSSDPAANAAVTFAGQGIVGTNIGISSDNCWGFTNSQAYRADVTSLVSGSGNYSVANLIKANVAEINGVELVVFFQDGNPANNHDVVIFDGNDSNISNPFDADGWNVSLPGINYTSGAASIEMIVSDGQAAPEAAITLNAQPFIPAGDSFDGNTVPNAGGPDTRGFLWDQRNFDATSFLTPGPNTLTLTMGLGSSDCLSLIAVAVELPPGAAPNQPATITVTKSVDGSAPAGATFTVDVVCQPVTGAPPTTVSATFNETGAPIGNNVLQVPSGSTCLAQEQIPLPAPTLISYACTPAASLDPSVCATTATSATVTVAPQQSGPVATVAVTNSYAIVILPSFAG